MRFRRRLVCVCLLLEDSVDHQQEKPGINSAVCTYFQEFFSGCPSEREYIGQAHQQRPQRRQCRLFFFDKVFWWFFLLLLSLFVPFSFSASLNEIPPYYNSIQLDWNTANERLLLCTCRRCDMGSYWWALYISMFRIDTRMYSDLFGLRETVRRHDAYIWGEQCCWRLSGNVQV